MKNEIKTILKQFKNKSLSKIFFKFIEIVYGYPLYFISFITPRDKNKILVGSHTPFNDNSKYFYLLTSLRDKNKRVIWIAHNRKLKNLIEKHGFEVYSKWSVLGLYHSLTAKIYVFCFHSIDINFWTSGNTIKINLWHGIPLKNIEFSVTTGSSVQVYDEKNIISRIFAPYIFVRPNFLISTSDIISDYYTKAFRMDLKDIKPFGQPRCDIFYKSKDELLDYINEYEPKIIKLIKITKNFSKTYIYMPTWRDYDFFKMAGFDFNKLNDKLIKEDSLFIIKVHPATPIDKEKLSKFTNIIVLENNVDIYPLLPFTDCLITDYSSIYYDYMLLNKGIILFPFDEMEYISKDRGFIWDYSTAMIAQKVYKFSDFINMIGSVPLLNEIDKKNLMQKYWGTYSGHSINYIDSLILGIE